MVKQTLVLFFFVVVSGQAVAEHATLACVGRVRLLASGRQVNPTEDRTSISISVDVEGKAFTMNGDETWPLSGNTSGDVIVAMSDSRGSATLNRITGAVSLHTIESTGLKIFEGTCRPAERLF